MTSLPTSEPTNRVFWVQYQTNQPVKIRTHQFIHNTGLWVQTLFDVADIIGAVQALPASPFAAVYAADITLHAVVDGPALEVNLPLYSLSTGLTPETALIIKSHKELTAAAPRRLRSNPANFEPKSVVAIYNSKDLIIPVPSGPKGRRWDSILHFLQAVCGNFEPSNYTLKQNVNGELVPIPVDLNLGELVPGRYFVIPNDGDDLMVDGVGFPIVPKSKLKRNTNSGGPSSPSMLRSPRVEALADDDKESLASSNSESSKRSGQFQESLIARDGHCVVTRDYGVVEAAHILAHSWWGDYANRRDSLPQDIRQIVSEMNGGINSVENGILLNGTLAKAFDEGKFGFVLREGHYYFVAITTDFLHLEGVQVDENLRKRSDDSCWWSEETRPHPRLVEFHFRNSVFKQMRGAASETEDSDSDSDVAADQIATGKPATSEMAPSEIIDWSLNVSYMNRNVPNAQ
ncbi:hypothetical protein HDU77_011351 [Chytriomyces hyalinus]|nr:hypothetical protein HDU77_011351 [Chytriomyces hyalinus]